MITPPLNGLILPGVTRLSLLELARGWKEFNVVERTVTMSEVIEAHKENRVRLTFKSLSSFPNFTFIFLSFQLIEIFGAGTACVVCPVSSISYQDKEYNIPASEESLSQRFYKTISDIHYGRVQHPWAVDVE